MFICEIWLFHWYFPQFCKSDMPKYGYLEVFQRVLRLRDNESRLYSRTSVAQTLIARLPRLLRTRSYQKCHSCRHYYLEKFLDDSNENTQHTLM